MATTLDSIEGLEEGCYRIVLNDDFELFFLNHALQVSKIKTSRTNYTRTVLVKHYSSDILDNNGWNCETRTGLHVIIPYDSIKLLTREDDL